MHLVNHQIDNQIIGLLRIDLCQAKNLGNVDAYIIAEIIPGVPIFQTESIPSNLPQWGASFQTLIYQNEASYVLSLHFMNHNYLSADNYLGKVEVSLADILQKKPSSFPFHEMEKEWLPLIDIQPILKSFRNENSNEGVPELCISASWSNFQDVEKWFWTQIIKYQIEATSTTNIFDLSSYFQDSSFFSETGLFSPSSPSSPSSLSSSGSIKSKSNISEISTNKPKISKETIKNILSDLKISFSFDFFNDSLEPITQEKFIEIIRTKKEEIRLNGTHIEHMIWKTACVCDQVFDKIVIEEISKRKNEIPKKYRISQFADSDDNIFVQDRETKKIIKELIPQHIHTFIKMLYANSAGLAMTETQGSTLLIQLSQNQGEYANSSKSLTEIADFIKLYNLDLDIIQDPIHSFKTFNEFFYRKIKMDLRPIDQDETIVVSPADCRMHVFENVTIAKQLWVKGHGFTLKTLLQDPNLESIFDGCSIVIARLAPQDYHRYHFPVSGQLGDFINQGNSLYTVNPIAIRSSIDVYSANKRVSVLMNNKTFGSVMYITVGATMVGSVVLTSTPQSFVQKGDEHGYFAFGGSTILLLFQKGVVEFDQDLLLNSQVMMETLVKVGTRIGKRRGT